MLACLVWVSSALSMVPASPSSIATDDWITTGWDCTVFGAGDVDGDGFGDVITRNGAGDLCVAHGVKGWKASNWEVLRRGVADGVQAIVAGAIDDRDGADVALVFADRTLVYSRIERGMFADETVADEAMQQRVDALRAAVADRDSGPPPHETEAPLLLHTSGDMDGDGRADAVGVFSATKPHQHRVVRIAVALHAGDDADGDGVSDAREAELGSDPHDRDTDDDGLLDGWEVNGLPRGIDPGDGALSPVRRDVILMVSRYAQLDEALARREVEKAKRLYAAQRVSYSVRRISRIE